MKCISKIVIFVFVIFLSFSCKKQQLPDQPMPSPFSVTVENSSAIPAAGSKVVVDIKAGSDGWWLTIPPETKSWCASSQVYGSGDKSITITFKPNATGASRAVSIIFNPTFDLPAQTINFQQDF
ncbi:MAG TPA: hypothetical protein VFF57_07255 [Hanamia sp.]|nr:hypothetical protein [Hanamia sp.]